MRGSTDRRGTSPLEPTEAANILVVEDDEPIRLALQELLEAEGYEVVQAENGREALGLLERSIPALVVTDINMPFVDGLQLCRTLRAGPRTRSVPIVVLTAAHQIDSALSTADAVIRKPFDIDDLLRVIAQFIRPTIPPRGPASTSNGRHLSAATHVVTTLVLYVTSGSSSSERAVCAVRAAVGVEGPPLEIVDVSLDSERASRDGIAMTPTLLRTRGGQRDVCLGDLTDIELLRECLQTSP
ncbi:MAG: hypothetical protein NVS3B20_12320 [Polyangiales bacterium]